MELPRRGGVEWFGDPVTDPSAFIVSFADTRPSDICREVALAAALRNGLDLTPELLREIDRRARAEDERFYAETRARGVAKSIRELFAAKRKKDLERLGCELILEIGDLLDLIHNSRILGLSHHSKFLSFEPDCRRLSKDEKATLFASDDDPRTLGEQKAAAKVRQFFVEREHRVVHMFSSSRDEWHCFFSNFDDTAVGENHWKGGSHVHFINHLFDPRKLTKKVVWKALSERRHTIPKLHIRFRDPRDAPSDRSLIFVDGETRRAKKVAPKAGSGC